MLRLVLADDHGVVLEGLRALLDTEPGMEVVALCRDGHEAVDAVEQHAPDVLIMDASMPDCDGVDAAARIKEMDSPVPIIILSATLDDGTLLRCLELGLEGLMLKESAAKTLTEAIRAVAGGERWIPAKLSERGLDLLTREREGNGAELTPRELEVVEKVVTGRSNRRAAKELGITEGTVKLHLHHVFRKLEVSSRMELAVVARERGLI